MPVLGQLLNQRLRVKVKLIYKSWYVSPPSAGGWEQLVDALLSLSSCVLRSPQQPLSLIHLPDCPDSVREQQISFSFPGPPLQGRGKGSCLTQHLGCCFSQSGVFLFHSVHCSPQTMTVAQLFESDPDFSFHSPG